MWTQLTLNHKRFYIDEEIELRFEQKSSNLIQKQITIDAATVNITQVEISTSLMKTLIGTWKNIRYCENLSIRFFGWLLQLIDGN